VGLVPVVEDAADAKDFFVGVAVGFYGFVVDFTGLDGGLLLECH